METDPTKINWEHFFNELDNAEEILNSAIITLKKSLEMGKFTKTGYKADEWRILHNQLSKNGKIIEKVYFVDIIICLFS